MKILVINPFGARVRSSNTIPRVGDKVDMFYDPIPSVTEVIMWPSKERLKQLNIDMLEIEAIITVS